MFRDVPGCSGMFRNVPGCSLFQVLSTPNYSVVFNTLINIAEREQSRTVGLPDIFHFDIGRFRVGPTDLRKVSTSG